MKYKKQLLEIIGWYGMIAILLAYSMVNLNLISSHATICIVLNLTGSLGLILVAAYKRVAQLVVLNAVWAMVAIISLVQLVSN